MQLYSAKNEVFFIDDDAAILTAYDRIARSANLRARVFPSVAEFMKAARSDEGAACIVCDVQMPETSGFELPGLLAEIGRPLPIIYVAGDDNPAKQSIAAQLGALAFFRKPVDNQMLLNAITRALLEWERNYRPRWYQTNPEEVDECRKLGR